MNSYNIEMNSGLKHTSTLICPAGVCILSGCKSYVSAPLPNRISALRLKGRKRLFLVFLWDY